MSGTAVAEKGAVAMREPMPVRVEINPEALIEKAIENNVAIEALQRLLDMRAQLKSEYAREAFFKALSKFQSECPTIVKTKQVLDKYGKPRYKYAPLEDIVSQVKEALERNGFSYTMKSRQEPGFLTTVCSVHHESGHTEETEITVPISSDGFMSSVQQIGSSVTYSKRYAFCNAFGIMTGDEDDDGAGDHGEPQKSAQAQPPRQEQKPQAQASKPAPAPASAPKPAPAQAQSTAKVKEGDRIPGEYWKLDAAGKAAMLPAGCVARKVEGVWQCVRA